MLKRLIAAAMLFVTPVMAQDAVQSAESVVVVPASDITQRLGAAPARPGAAVSSNVTVTDRYIALFSHRTADGTPEQHAKWTDVMVMLQGDFRFIAEARRSRRYQFIGKFSRAPARDEKGSGASC